MNIDLALQWEKLERCLQLGMEREALRQAGRILRAADLAASTFTVADWSRVFVLCCKFLRSG